MGAAPSCDYSDYVAKNSVEQELRTVERQIEDCASSSKCNYSAELADYVRRADILDTHTLKTTCANDSPCMQKNNNFDVAVKKYPIMFVPRTMGTVGKACDAVVCSAGHHQTFVFVGQSRRHRNIMLHRAQHVRAVLEEH